MDNEKPTPNPRGIEYGIDQPARHQSYEGISRHTPNARTPFELALEAFKHEYYRQINADLFADGEGHAGGFRAPPTPTWRSRVAGVVWRVQAYVWTVWRAVKGEDPFEGDDY